MGVSDFWNYPIPQKGPDRQYNNDAGSNPVLRGASLAIVSSMSAIPII